MWCPTCWGLSQPWAVDTTSAPMRSTTAKVPQRNRRLGRSHGTMRTWSLCGRRRKPSVRAHGRLSRLAARSLGRSRCTRSRRRARAVHGRPRSATDGLDHFTRKGPAAARLVASSSPAGAPRPASHHLAARGTAARCVDRFTSLHESSRTAARRRRPCSPASPPAIKCARRDHRRGADDAWRRAAVRPTR